MFIAQFSTYIFWLVLFLLNFSLAAADSAAAATIKIQTNNFDVQDVPVDIVKMCPALHNMIEELGGYEVWPQDSLIPVSGIDTAHFTQFIDFLRATKFALHAPDLSQVSKSALRNAFEAELSPEKKDSGQLQRLMTAANFLDVKEPVQIGAKNWAKNYSHTQSSLNDAIVDLKELVLSHLTPKAFMRHVSANNNQVSKDTFKLALKVHYDETLPEGKTAQSYYESLRQTIGFVRIPGGEYEIGSPEDEKNHNHDERLHSVTLSPFSIMEAAVRQEDYEKVMGKNPSHSKNGDYPVENVTWFDANAFAQKKSQNDPKWNYHLPTEAELEVAFRGGTKTAYVCGDDEQGLEKFVWYSKNSNAQTWPVKSKFDNDYGIWRSSVWEWTGDWYDAAYKGSAGLDPTGPTSGSNRAVRGGGWHSHARYCRSAYRGGIEPQGLGCNLGFRLVRTKK
jgi:formylglycine-generating enzyme